MASSKNRKDSCLKAVHPVVGARSIPVAGRLAHKIYQFSKFQNLIAGTVLLDISVVPIEL